jgi:hypothetical protein
MPGSDPLDSSRQEQPQPDSRSRAGEYPPARTVPPELSQWILMLLMREAEHPTWSVLTPARRVIWYADSNLDLLRAARALLIQGAASDTHPASSQARALVTVDIAIADLNEISIKKHQSQGGSGRDPRGEPGRAGRRPRPRPGDNDK